MSSDPLCPLDKDLAVKLGAVGAPIEQEIREWIESLTGEKFSSPSFGKALKNGILLCKLANAIKPGSVPKIQTAAAPFVQMENINAFLNAERTFGVPTADLFMTVDLFEEKNIGQVIRSLAALKRILSTGGAKLGSSSSSSAPRKLSTGPAPAYSVAPPAPAPTASGASSGAKFCTQCGTKAVGGAKFCGECGGKM